ncbi:hypothetical protein MHB45_27800 [Peribacillus sp. FSL K6-5616]|uniref:hypothetical protein n=1 Tax=Peribacillus sp. FSL K6-5616 TaxID=2921508 RepID=UPI00065FB27F|nr:MULTISPECIES: hypothetical protein [Bacillaceae]MCT1390145.1 hypothetical protein [Peribacillus frigoritolerans]
MLNELEQVSSTSITPIRSLVVDFKFEEADQKRSAFFILFLAETAISMNGGRTALVNATETASSNND